jgi:hypothetical protein
MKALVSVIVVVGAISTSLVGLAQTSESITTRPSGYDRLNSFIGRWTIKGSEAM